MSCNEFQGRFPLQTHFIFHFSAWSRPLSVPCLLAFRLMKLQSWPYAELPPRYPRPARQSIIIYVISHWTWVGGLRKGFRAKTGYEINERTGLRRDVCLHVARKLSEPAGMRDRWEASAVLFHQYCDFFPSSRLILSPRRDRERGIHSCGACWGGWLRPS